MDQKITLNIANQAFPVKAANPEMERFMRIAAEDINKMLARYDEKYPDKSMTDKLLFVVLTQAVSRLQAQKKLNDVSAENEKLLSELSAYLKDIENNR
ncbi:MAG: cell division protein ZapA [Bacteroidales bacterium]|nr:cell division protein ZapA [Bacteroidales bacterium]